MQVWNVLYGARWKYRTQKVVKKSPSGHHRTTLSGYIFATKARIDNRKKNLLSSNISSTCSHNMVNFGPQVAEINPVVWGTHANFNGFRVLAALLHGSQYWASAKLCRVEQRAPPIFGRAAITLGIGPHSSSPWSSPTNLPPSLSATFYTTWHIKSQRFWRPWEIFKVIRLLRHSWPRLTLDAARSLTVSRVELQLN